MRETNDEVIARKQVKRLRHFYHHLTTYGAVIVFLHLINLFSGGGYWAIWPTLGWGIAIAIHASSTLDLMPFFGAEWEERKVREILAKK